MSSRYSRIGLMHLGNEVVGFNVATRKLLAQLCVFHTQAIELRAEIAALHDRAQLLWWCTVMCRHPVAGSFNNIP